MNLESHLIFPHNASNTSPHRTQASSVERKGGPTYPAVIVCIFDPLRCKLLWCITVYGITYIWLGADKYGHHNKYACNCTTSINISPSFTKSLTWGNYLSHGKRYICPSIIQIKSLNSQIMTRNWLPEPGEHFDTQLFTNVGVFNIQCITFCGVNCIRCVCMHISTPLQLVT